MPPTGPAIYWDQQQQNQQSRAPQPPAEGYRGQGQNPYYAQQQREFLQGLNPYVSVRDQPISYYQGGYQGQQQHEQMRTSGQPVVRLPLTGMIT